MPLSVFQYDPPRHFREVVGKSDRFGHTFGGEPSEFGIQFVNSEPFHLVYRLNQDDPAVAVGIPGIQWLPLCYHFSFAAFDGKLIYRVQSDLEIEVIAPIEANFDRDFPRPEFPRFFPACAARFRAVAYNATVAEDALRLAEVFGIDRLSRAELKKAVAIARKAAGPNGAHTLSGWEPEQVIQELCLAPFCQGAPLKGCTNPNCTAEVLERVESQTIEISSPVVREVTGQSNLTVDAYVRRRDSMRVFAILIANEGSRYEGDDRVWPDVQLVYEVCDICHCVRVTNQCT